MAAARVGALRVDLGLNSAQFQRGLKHSEMGMKRFAQNAKRAFAAVGVAATGAAVALGYAVKSAANHADKLSKTAQSVGLLTEELSRLEWAADLSGVSLDQLATGLQRLNRNVLDVSQGAGETARRAFDGLNISVTKADGSLKSTNDLLLEVADRFSTMEDGVAKTGYAMSLFGRAGAQMIPLLNQGRDGIADMTAEADRLGITISTKTGRAAEKFNDTLNRISKIMQGVGNKIMEAALPALQQLAGTLASPKFAEAAQKFATWAVNALNAIFQVVSGIINAISDLTAKINEGLQRVKAKDTQRDLAELRRELEYWKAKESKPDLIQWAGDAEHRLKRIAELQAEIARRMAGGSQLPVAPTPPERPNRPSGFVIPTIDLGDMGFGTGDGTVDQINMVADAVDDLGQSAVDAGQSIADSLSSAMSGLFSEIRSGVPALEAISNRLSNLADQLLDTALSAAISGIFNGGGTSPIALPQLFGGGGGPSYSGPSLTSMRFANGGSFRVGGSGGTDSQFVSFMATPGEMVDVRTPGQAANSNRINLEISFSDVANIQAIARDEAGNVVGQAAAPIASAGASQAINGIGAGRADRSMQRFGSRPRTVAR